MTIKAIVLDIDGTLLNDEKQLTKETKAALINAQKSGIKVILASGRPTTGMLKYVDELEMERYNGLIVSYNGAHVLDVGSQKVLFSQPLSIENSKDILEHLKQFEVKPMIAQGDYMYVNNVYDCMVNLDAPHGSLNIIEYESRGGNFQLCEKNDLAAFVDFPLHKILVAGHPDYLQKNWQNILGPFKEKVSGVFSAPMYFEFTDQGIDKANALEKTLKPLGIQREHIVSFGDGHNDVSLINYAGIGIAMGNAVDELKNVANKVTASNNDDGIAQALAKLL
ncbi:Cof-type HAD-IIB family hydrolase [Enterococcus quebecensis]|uniref:HAD family hydrolase n=1 Tax=Enterococcus quebecensis TaxID=903983 RepID=A0A1E5H2Z8_9ENTE|nr:Cof-type HAD-IIB family hydrolase [Enterococcus quebecensis]OEG19286.1 HAD family hydrolase [Enterococcus quebecensis]OJG75799.1 cof-like hydrolase [Enterococcus quebecensis]